MQINGCEVDLMRATLPENIFENVGESPITNIWKEVHTSSLIFTEKQTNEGIQHLKISSFKGKTRKESSCIIIQYLHEEKTSEQAGDQDDQNK